MIESIKDPQNAFLLKTRFDRYGYEIVTLWINGKSITRKVHRLALLAFQPIDNPDEFTVNHKDGDKSNNRRSNLEWLTVEENHRHAFKTGLHKVGENRTAGRAVKLTDENVREIKALIKDGFSNTQIAECYNVTCGCIYSIRLGKSWKHIN